MINVKGSRHKSFIVYPTNGNATHSTTARATPRSRRVSFRTVSNFLTFTPLLFSKQRDLKFNKCRSQRRPYFSSDTRGASFWPALTLVR